MASSCWISNETSFGCTRCNSKQLTSRNNGKLNIAITTPKMILEMFSSAPKFRQRKLTQSLATQSIELQIKSKLILNKFILLASQSLHRLIYSFKASIYSSFMLFSELPSEPRSSTSWLLAGGWDFTISTQFVQRYSVSSSMLRFLQI